MDAINAAVTTLGTITLYLTDGVKKQGQAQITFSFDGAPLFAKGDRHLFTLRSTKGECTLVRGDTHGIWKSHQITEAQVLAWDAIRGMILAKGVCKLAVVKVEDLRSSQPTADNGLADLQF